MTIYAAVELILKSKSRQLPTWFENLGDSAIDEMTQNQEAFLKIDSFDKTYLEFLKGQIELCARGPEWNVILEERLAALKPFANVPLADLVLIKKGEMLSAKICLDPIKVVHVEIT